MDWIFTNGSMSLFVHFLDLKESTGKSHIDKVNNKIFLNITQTVINTLKIVGTILIQQNTACAELETRFLMKRHMPLHVGQIL